MDLIALLTMIVEIENEGIQDHKEKELRLELRLSPDPSSLRVVVVNE